jgi:hypothetical protein
MRTLLVSDAECVLVEEALHHLVARKRKAITNLDSLPRDSHLRTAFTPHDLGIPRIEDLLARIEAAPELR